MFFNNSRYRRPEWGSETGVEGKQNSRTVLLRDLTNYRRITHNGFNFYLSIIDTKHPKYIRTTDRGFDRWRMRFNVFATGFFAKWMPNTVLHYGEIHVYYDLMADKPKPWYLDFTFYYDNREMEVEVLMDRLQRMDSAFRDSLIGNYRSMKFMLLLPISSTEFIAPDKDLDEFLERQEVILLQLEELKRRNRISIIAIDSSNGCRNSVPNTRSQNFAGDFDSRNQIMF